MIDDALFEVLPNTAAIDAVTFTPRFSTVCSVGKAPFWGHVSIIFMPDEALLEFESFETWLRGFADRRLTIEEFCREVFDALMIHLVPRSLSVSVHAETTVHAQATATISTE